MKELWATLAALGLLCACQVHAQDADTPSSEEFTTEPTMTSTTSSTPWLPGLNPNHSYYPPRYNPPFGGYNPNAWRYKPNRIWPQQGFTPTKYGPSYYNYHVPSTYDWWKTHHRSPSFDQNGYYSGGHYPQSGYGRYNVAAWPYHWYPYYGTGTYQYPTGYYDNYPHYRTYRSYPSYGDAGTYSWKRDQTPYGYRGYYPYQNRYYSQDYPYQTTSYSSYPYSSGGSYPYYNGGYGSGHYDSYPSYYGSSPHSHYDSSHYASSYPSSYYGSYPNYYSRSYYGSGPYYPYSSNYLASHQGAYSSYGSGYNPGYTNSPWNCDWHSGSYYKNYATGNTKPWLKTQQTRSDSYTRNQPGQYGRRALMEETANVDQEPGFSSRSLRSVSSEDKASHVDRTDLETPDDGKLMALVYSRVRLTPEESYDKQEEKDPKENAGESSGMQISTGGIRQHFDRIAQSQERKNREGGENVPDYFKKLVQQTRKLSDDGNKLGIDKAKSSRGGQELTTLYLAFKSKAGENDGSSEVMPFGEQEIYFDPSMSLTDRINVLSSFYNMLPKTGEEEQDDGSASEEKNGSDEATPSEPPEDGGSNLYEVLTKVVKHVSTVQVAGEQGEGDDVNDLDAWEGDSQFQVKGSVTLDVDLEGKSNSADDQYIQLLKSLL